MVAPAKAASSFQHTSDTLDAIADRIAAIANLDDFGAVVLAIYGLGYRGAEFADEIHEIMALAKERSCFSGEAFK